MFDEEDFECVDGCEPLISCSTTIYVDCASPNAEKGCHISIDTDYNPMFEEVDVHEWLEDHGWLYLGPENGAYCPVCRKQLHD